MCWYSIDIGIYVIICGRQCHLNSDSLQFRWCSYLDFNFQRRLRYENAIQLSHDDAFVLFYGCLKIYWDNRSFESWKKFIFETELTPMSRRHAESVCGRVGLCLRVNYRTHKYLRVSSSSVQVWRSASHCFSDIQCKYNEHLRYIACVARQSYRTRWRWSVQSKHICGRKPTIEPCGGSFQSDTWATDKCIIQLDNAGANYLPQLSIVHLMIIIQRYCQLMMTGHLK